MIEPWYKKVWIWLVAIFGALVGAFLYQKKRADDAESQVESIEMKKEDAVLEERLNNIAKEDLLEREKLEALKKLEVEVEKLTPEQVKDYWKDK